MIMSLKYNASYIKDHYTALAACLKSIKCNTQGMLSLFIVFDQFVNKSNKLSHILKRKKTFLFIRLMLLIITVSLLLAELPIVKEKKKRKIPIMRNI